MNSSDYKLIELVDRIYVNNLCCPMPPLWAELSNRICSEQLEQNALGERYPTSLILGGWWESSEAEKRGRLLEQVLFAYRHGKLQAAYDYLMSLDDDKWHKMDG
jgi:hypothetical protein